MISTNHAALLVGSGIALDVAEAAGIYTVETVDELPESFRWCKSAPGIVFPWHSLNGEPVDQYRPDVAVELDGKPSKYLWPKGCAPVLDVHPLMRARVTAPTVLIVEGTKQHLAAVSTAPDDVAVVGIVGCWGWSSGGVPLPELLDVTGNKQVVVIFDADVTGNRKVYDAATRLGEALEVGGAGTVAFAQIPASGTAGLDDFLVAQPDPTASLARLMARAGPLPKAPRAKKSSHPFFDSGGLKVEALFESLVGEEHLALDASGRILHYRDGVYRPNQHALTGLVADRLGDRYRSMHLRSVEEFTAARLAAAQKVIPDTSNNALVNVSNGMLDPLADRLEDHDPRHLSAMQFPVVYDPTATCPAFDAWLVEVVGDRGDDLLEAAARILDRRRARQSKALFLWGPTRSGKSTFVRLLEMLVGVDARSAITLHDLAGDRFAAADAYGKALNAAADLSAAHVSDLSVFKQMTGADPVRAQRKFGQPFVFTNTALFVFSTNTIPTVSEVSRAYLARVRPYQFGTSFEGREDPELESRLRAELPGIFNRLVEAFQRFEARGGYADDEASRDALDVFSRHSDRVRLFLHEATDDDPEGFVSRSALFEGFEEWARQNRREQLGRHRFFASIETAGYRPVKRAGTRGFVGLDVRNPDDWGDDDDERGRRGTSAPTSAHEEQGGGVAGESLVRERCGGTAPSAPPGEPVATQVATANPDELGEDWF